MAIQREPTLSGRVLFSVDVLITDSTGKCRRIRRNGFPTMDSAARYERNLKAVMATKNGERMTQGRRLP